MKVSISGEGPKFKEAARWLKARRVRIGIPGGGGSHGSLSNVELAFLLTNGSPVNRNPPRPFLQPALQKPESQEKIAREMKKAAAAAVNGNFGGAHAQLGMAGQAGEDAVKEYMESGAFAPNAPITVSGGWMKNPRRAKSPEKAFYVKGKGSSKPLIDTGDLHDSITHIVE